MRIGVIASPWIPVPPPAYGGTETVIHNLCVGLQSLGHDVHLVTVGTSTCPVRRSAVFDEPPTGIGEPVAEIVQVREAYELLEGVDVIHDHTTIGPQCMSRTVRPTIPVVTTVHGVFHRETQMMYASRPPGLAVVAISHAQRARAPEVAVDAVIHHGIDLELHREGPGGGGYLMFVGRMSPDKGPDRAIEVARRAGRPLVLAAKMREPQEVAYFQERVRPLLGEDVRFVGEADAETRLDLLRHADGLLNPIRWPEPFGLVMAESLAAGTPVIALRHGAAPEIVDDGCTGFLCDHEDDMVEAVAGLPRIERRACRAAAEQRFSRERMAADHAALYARLRRRALSPAPLGAVPAISGAASPADLSGPAVPGDPAGSPVIAPIDLSRTRGRDRRGACTRHPLGGYGTPNPN